jgi:flagellar biosynthesis GTPase FlhF
MNNTKTRFRLLQLFADGGAEGNAAGIEAGATEGVAAPQSGDLPVTFLDEGTQVEEVPAAEEQKATETPDLDAEFDALIKKDGKFADIYKKRVEKVVKGRLKDSKEQAETLQKSQRVMQKLAQVYGVDPADFEAVEKAIDSDDNLYTQAAMDADMSVEAYKELMRTKAENAVYKKAQEEQLRQERIDETYRKWISDSEEVKKVYPNFDLETELQNPVFNGLLRNGFPVQNAYESAHIQELMTSAMQAGVSVA